MNAMTTNLLVGVAMTAMWVGTTRSVAKKRATRGVEAPPNSSHTVIPKGAIRFTPVICPFTETSQLWA